MKFPASYLVGLPCVLPAAPQAEAASDGGYSIKEANCRIEVKFVLGNLVGEPNRTSEYIQRPDTGIYDFKNPTNGISYVLKVAEGGRALIAYKPGTLKNITAFALVRATAPAASGSATGVVRIRVQNKDALNSDLEELWGVRQIEGVSLEGRYTPDGEPHPFLAPKPKGEGTMEMHGAPEPEHVYPSLGGSKPTVTGLVKTDGPAAVERSISSSKKGSIRETSSTVWIFPHPRLTAGFNQAIWP